MDILSFSPTQFYKYFMDIARIPHGSGNTAALADYICAFAEENGIDHERDEIGNVLLRGKATPGYEDHPAVLLGGHLDMVCVSDPGVEIDFMKDPIPVATDGEWIYAEGTTLGADDAYALAMMMALLTDEGSQHPALECLCTMDEEVGMYGAKAFDPAWITSRRLLNLDNDTWGTLVVGCAGGAEVHSCIPVERVTLKGGRYTIKVSGLKGGHSGSAIIFPRANSNKLMGRILRDLSSEYSVSIVDIKGGGAMNAITLETECEILADTADQSGIIAYCAKLTETLRKEYAGSDDGITVQCIPQGPGTVEALSFDSAKKVITYLEMVPHGMMRLMPEPFDVPALSTNLARVGFNEGCFTAGSLVRSAVGASKRDLCDRIIYLTETLGGTYEIKADMPEWPYNPDSELTKLFVNVYKDMFGSEPKIAVSHGCQECGIFCDKLPGLDVISFAPDLPGLHTTGERMRVSTAEKCYNLLKALLAVL